MIGLGVIAWMMYKEFDPSALELVEFGWWSVFWIIVGALCMVGRDLGYMIRLRILSDGKLTWGQLFRIIMLWEFTSAVTPSAVGGTSVALLYVHKEGLSVGHSTAIVMLTSFLDELYFVLIFPLVWWIVGSRLFEVADASAWGMGLMWVALIGYSVKTLWTLLLGYGLLFNPKGLARLIYRLFHLRLLRRWRKGAAKTAVELISSSRLIRQKKIGFWIKAFLSTALSWTSRYWVVNALLLAFFAVGDHFLLFARQLVMWIALLVSPTPGGSGIAEYMFTGFLGEFVPIAGFAIVLALFWRMLTYYPYLIVGAFMVPRWWNKHFSKKKTKKAEVK